MAVATATTRPAVRVAAPASGGGATRVVVAVLGTLVGLAGVEHGVGEMLQGPVRPGGLLIMSWPDAAALEILSGEPALTVVPNLLVTGVLAVAVGLAVVVWSVWVRTAQLRGAGVDRLVGAVGAVAAGRRGLAPPLMGFVVGAVATRMTMVPRRRPGGLGRVIGPVWRWFMAAAVLGYLGLIPGMVLASGWGVASEALTVGLAAFAFAFANFALALTAARAHDRLEAATR